MERKSWRRADINGNIKGSGGWLPPATIVLLFLPLAPTPLFGEAVVSQELSLAPQGGVPSQDTNLAHDKVLPFHNQVPEKNQESLYV